MDTNYGLIRINTQNELEIHFFKYFDFSSKQYPICFRANAYNLNYLFYLLSLYKKFNTLSTQHKLYFGKEILKSQITIKLNQKYIQE
uniref:Uncharacterized protein n=1 Tax=Kuetzingia canaliculata TaxID=228262 RepID=A0A1Z1MNZ9_KUECA|nr:hypothetical protein [Kuetzingia canaliculata]ARW67833.1 hypothetical protein [Kuetzingia canaliculata]